MAKFRTKPPQPVVVDAIQFHCDLTMTELYEWAGVERWENARDPNAPFVAAGRGILVMTPGGPVEAILEDWIIKDIMGGFYIEKPEAFATFYEPAPACRVFFNSAGDLYVAESALEAAQLHLARIFEQDGMLNDFDAFTEMDFAESRADWIDLDRAGLKVTERPAVLASTSPKGYLGRDELAL